MCCMDRCCPAAPGGATEFAMSMTRSNISPSFQIHPQQQLRIMGRYNATVRHTGGIQLFAV